MNMYENIFLEVVEKPISTKDIPKMSKLVPNVLYVTGVKAVGGGSSNIKSSSPADDAYMYIFSDGAKRYGTKNITGTHRGSIGVTVDGKYDDSEYILAMELDDAVRKNPALAKEMYDSGFTQTLYMLSNVEKMTLSDMEDWSKHTGISSSRTNVTGASSKNIGKTNFSYTDPYGRVVQFDTIEELSGNVTDENKLNEIKKAIETFNSEKTYNTKAVKFDDGSSMQFKEILKPVYIVSNRSGEVVGRVSEAEDIERLPEVLEDDIISSVNKYISSGKTDKLDVKNGLYSITRELPPEFRGDFKEKISKAVRQSSILAGEIENLIESSADDSEIFETESFKELYSALLKTTPGLTKEFLVKKVKEHPLFNKKFRAKPQDLSSHKKELRYYVTDEIIDLIKSGASDSEITESEPFKKLYDDLSKNTPELTKELLLKNIKEHPSFGTEPQDDTSNNIIRNDAENDRETINVDTSEEKKKQLSPFKSIKEAIDKIISNAKDPLTKLGPHIDKSSSPEEQKESIYQYLEDAIISETITDDPYFTFKNVLEKNYLIRLMIVWYGIKANQGIKLYNKHSKSHNLNPIDLSYFDKAEVLRNIVKASYNTGLFFNFDKHEDKLKSSSEIEPELGSIIGLQNRIKEEKEKKKKENQTSSEKKVDVEEDKPKETNEQEDDSIFGDIFSGDTETEENKQPDIKLDSKEKAENMVSDYKKEKADEESEKHKENLEKNKEVDQKYRDKVLSGEKIPRDEFTDIKVFIVERMKEMTKIFLNKNNIKDTSDEKAMYEINNNMPTVKKYLDSFSVFSTKNVKDKMSGKIVKRTVYEKGLNKTQRAEIEEDYDIWLRKYFREISEEPAGSGTRHTRDMQDEDKYVDRSAYSHKDISMSEKQAKKASEVGLNIDNILSVEDIKNNMEELEEVFGNDLQDVVNTLLDSLETGEEESEVDTTDIEIDSDEEKDLMDYSSDDEDISDTNDYTSIENFEDDIEQQKDPDKITLTNGKIVSADIIGEDEMSKVDWRYVQSLPNSWVGDNSMINAARESYTKSTYPSIYNRLRNNKGYSDLTPDELRKYAANLAEDEFDSIFLVGNSIGSYIIEDSVNIKGLKKSLKSTLIKENIISKLNKIIQRKPVKSRLYTENVMLSGVSFIDFLMSKKQVVF